MEKNIKGKPAAMSVLCRRKEAPDFFEHVSDWGGSFRARPVILKRGRC